MINLSTSKIKPLSKWLMYFKTHEMKTWEIKMYHVFYLRKKLLLIFIFEIVDNNYHMSKTFMWLCSHEHVFWYCIIYMKYRWHTLQTFKWLYFIELGIYTTYTYINQAKRHDSQVYCMISEYWKPYLFIFRWIYILYWSIHHSVR